MGENNKEMVFNKAFASKIYLFFLFNISTHLVKLSIAIKEHKSRDSFDNQIDKYVLFLNFNATFKIQLTGMST